MWILIHLFIFEEVTAFTMLLKISADDDWGNSVTHAFPRSAPTLGSIGRTPKSGTFTSLANSSPPPLLKMLVHSVQLGQTNLKF